LNTHSRPRRRCGEPPRYEQGDLVANTKFERHESFPLADCFFLASGWFWKIRFKKTTFGKFYLVDGAGLTGASNAYLVVPNSDAAFLGKTGQERRRLVQLYGLSPGTCLVDFNAGAPGDPVVTMQVEVDDLPGDRPSFVKPTAKSAGLIGPNLPSQYQLDFMQSVTSGPAESLFDGVPVDTKHIVVSSHGQMSAGGITMSIAGGVSRSNCADVFKKLKKCAGGVVWISGCDAGSDNEFCKNAAMASGCYIVAPAITVPVVRVPHGMFDYFERSMIKFFSKDKGDLMKAADFLQLQNDLSFHIVPG
jgi:hypothetical protein